MIVPFKFVFRKTKPVYSPQSAKKMSTTREDGVPTYHAPDRAAWRTWLATHHAREVSVWLIIYKKASDTPSVYYDEAVDEALCFGWIDSKPNKRDAESYFQFFSRRNPKSNWSRVNKEKVARLQREGRMTEPGLAMVRQAQESGTWTALNDVDNLVVPDDLRQALDKNSAARDHFHAFPPSARRGILEWIFTAKRPETRQRRIEQTVAEATYNRRANAYRP